MFSICIQRCNIRLPNSFFCSQFIHGDVKRLSSSHSFPTTLHSCSIRVHPFCISKGKISKGISAGSNEFLPEFDPLELFYDLNPNPQNLSSIGDGEVGGEMLEAPCQSCKGKGYHHCPDCEMVVRPTCTSCQGTGRVLCDECRGNQLVQMKGSPSVWELPVKSLASPEDEDIEAMTNPVRKVPRKASSRVYGPLSPELRAKISRRMKEYEAKTGSMSKRMKHILSTPALRTQLRAAQKKPKESEAWRENMSKRMKSVYSDPSLRQKLSLLKKGVKPRCSVCGQKGHRKTFCPTLGFLPKQKISQLSVGHKKCFSRRCTNCGETGHNRATCRGINSISGRKSNDNSITGKKSTGDSITGKKSTGDSITGKKSTDNSITGKKSTDITGKKSKVISQRPELIQGTFVQSKELKEESKGYKCSLYDSKDHTKRNSPKMIDKNFPNQVIYARERNGSLEKRDVIQLNSFKMVRFGYRSSEKEEEESKSKRTVIKCGICGNKGHNQRTCKMII